jgi:hypothetical protein
MCCCYMYSVGVVILSIVGKRLSAILHILLVIGTCMVQNNTQDVLWNTRDVLENRLNFVLQYLIKRWF